MKNVFQIAAFIFAVVMVGCTTKNDQIEHEEITEEIVEIASVNTSDTLTNSRTVVFIAGYDKSGSSYYSNAKAYFQNQDFEIVESAYSLQEIILWLNVNYNDIPYDNIHIVNKNKLNKMSLETTIKGENVSNLTLNKAISENKLPGLDDNVFTETSKIIFHSNGIASNTDLLQNFKQVFESTVTPEIIASEYASIFDSEFAPQYLAKMYYGYYPTAQSPGRVDLAKQFQRSYPEANINWLSVMNNDEERYLGDVYSYKFNVPVRWDIEFHGDEEMPTFNTDEELITWMKNHEEISAELNDIGIPLNKFRWYQTSINDTLIIKGKVTVICVLEPLMNFAYPTQYMVPNIHNQRLYDVL